MERYSWKIRRLRDWAERCRAQVRIRSLWPVLTFFQSFTAVTASSMLVIWSSGITRGRLTTSKSLSWQFWPKRQNLSFAVSGEEVSRSETENYTSLISLLIRDIAIPWFVCLFVCLFVPLRWSLCKGPMLWRDQVSDYWREIRLHLSGDHHFYCWMRKKYVTRI